MRFSKKRDSLPDVERLAQLAFASRSAEDLRELQAQIADMHARLTKRGVLHSGVYTWEMQNFAGTHCATQYSLAADAIIEACSNHGISWTPKLGDALYEAAKTFAKGGCICVEGATQLVYAPNKSVADKTLEQELMHAQMRGDINLRSKLVAYVATLATANRLKQTGTRNYIVGALFTAALAGLIALLTHH